MSDINDMRCYASELIIKIMNADAPVEERATQLELLKMHAESAHEHISGVKALAPIVQAILKKTEDAIARMSPEDQEKAKKGIQRVVTALESQK